MLSLEAQPAARAGATSVRPVLLLVFIAALVLRAWGLAFGLPYAYHVDESVFNLVARNAAESGLRSLEPNFSLFQLLVIAEYKLFTAVEPIVRLLPLPSDVAAALDWRYVRYNVVARVHSAILGAATVVPVYLLGRSLWNRQVGLLAAGFLAACYIHVRDSHFGVPDTTVVFFTTLAAYYCTRIWFGAPVRRYALAGFLCGLAVASKQLAWPIFLLLILFHALAPAPEGPPAAPLPPRVRIARLFHWKIVMAGAIGIATYLACVPQTVLRWSEFWAYWQGARLMGAKGGMDRLRIDDTGPFGTYLYALRWGMGEVLFVLGIVGLAIWLIRPPSIRVRLALTFVIVYFAFLLLPGNMYMSRYVMSAVPMLLLAAAALISAIVLRVPLRGRARAAAWVLVLGAVLAQPLVASVRHNVLLTRTDTRTLAKEWFERNVPDGAAVMLEFWWFSPPLSSAAEPVPFSARTYRLMGRGAYGLSEVSNGFGPSKGILSVADYARLGVEYIVSNSYSSGSSLLDPAEDRAKSAFYEELDREAELLAEFSPYVEGQRVPRIFAEAYGPVIHLSRYERPGPVLRIYRVRPPFMLPGR